MAAQDRCGVTPPPGMLNGWYRSLRQWLPWLDDSDPATNATLRAELHEHLAAAEAALEGKRKRLAEMDRASSQLRDEEARLESERRDAERSADLALMEDREEIARSALRAGLETRRALERVSNRLRALDRQSRQLASLLEEQERRLEGIRREEQELDHSVPTWDEPLLDVPGASAVGQGEAGQVVASQVVASSNDAIDLEEIELEMLRRKRDLGGRRAAFAVTETETSASNPVVSSASPQ